MRLDESVFVRLAPLRGFLGALTPALVALSTPEPRRERP